MSAVRLIGGSPALAKVSAYKTTIFSQIVPRCQNIPDTIVIVAPCPETNMYQTVSSLRVSPELPLRSLPLDGGKYLYWEQNGTCEPLLRRFNVTVYAIKTDFSKIKRVDKPTQKHRCFIQNTGAYIVADDPNSGHYLKVQAPDRKTQ